MVLFVRRSWIVAVGVAVVLVAIGALGLARYQAGQTVAEAENIAAVLHVGAGSRVADVGAGSGTYTVELAHRIMPNGYVYATEINPENLAAIRLAVAEAGLDNVTTIESRAADTGLPPGCCDGIVLRTVYHHLTDAAPFVADLFTAARPGARLAIIDFPPSGSLSLIARVDDVPENRGGHGIPPDVVIDELTTAGFTLEEQIEDWGGGNYCLVFRRSATDP